MIKTFDNIIPEYFQDFIYNYVTSKIETNPYPLHYIDNLTNYNDNNEVGFGNTFFNNSYLAIHGTPLLTPLYLFLTSQKLILKELIQGRVFLQISDCKKQPTIQEPHTDQKYDHYAMLYYANDTDGDTYFYSDTEGKNIIKQVSPKKGRIVFFNGNIWHSGSSTTQNLRIVLNYNFLI